MTLTLEQTTISVDPAIAQAYQAASENDKQKAQALLRFFFKDLENQNRENRKSSLFQLMDEISDEAVKNGMTPEILDQILNEK